MNDGLVLGDKPDLLMMRPGLRILLTQGADWKSCVRLIAINPVLKAEAERVLPLLDEALTSYADCDAIADALRARGADYALEASVMTRELIQPYLDALWVTSVSSYVLADAFRRWQACELYPKHPARHSVYPKPDELRALCGKSSAIISAMRFRVRKALEHHEAPRKSEADKAAVRAMAAAWPRDAL